MNAEDIKERLINNFGIMFADANFDNPRSETQKAAFMACKAFRGKSLYLQGIYATGKTHALAALYALQLGTGYKIKVFTAKSLSEWMREEDLRTSLTQSIRELCHRFKIFIIDDLDKTKWTESFDSNFYAFIDELYKNQKTIYISANKSLKELVEIQGFNGASVRRIQDMSEIIRF